MITASAGQFSFNLQLQLHAAIVICLFLNTEKFFTEAEGSQWQYSRGRDIISSIYQNIEITEHKKYDFYQTHLLLPTFSILARIMTRTAVTFSCRRIKFFKPFVQLLLGNLFKKSCIFFLDLKPCKKPFIFNLAYL